MQQLGATGTLKLHDPTTVIQENGKQNAAHDMLGAETYNLPASSSGIKRLDRTRPLTPQRRPSSTSDATCQQKPFSGLEASVQCKHT